VPPPAADTPGRPKSMRHAAVIGGVVVLAGIAWLVAARWTDGSRDGSPRNPADVGGVARGRAVG
jgi:hypothetical protein